MFKKIVPNVTVLASLMRVKPLEREGILDPRELFIKVVYEGIEYIVPYGNTIPTFPDLKDGSNIINISTHELAECTDTALVDEMMIIKTHLSAPDVEIFSKTNDPKINLEAIFTPIENLVLVYTIQGEEKTFSGNISATSDLLDGIYDVEFNLKDDLGYKSTTNTKSITVDTLATAKPTVVGSLNSQSTVIKFEWQNTELEKQDIAKYRYKITGEEEFTEVSKTVTSVTKDVKVNGSYIVTVQSGDDSGNWSEESTFTTIVSSLSVSSLKFVDVVDQKLYINNNFKDLTESFDNSYIKNRMPLFFIQTTSDNLVLAPCIVKISVIENVVKGMIDDLETLTDLNEIKATTKLIMQIRSIEKQYGDKPFAICISTSSFCDLMTTSVDLIDLEFKDMLYAEKRIKAVIDLSFETSSSVYFNKANEIMKDFLSMYFAVDKHEELAMDLVNIYKINNIKKVANRYTPSSLSNFVPDFTLDNTAGITNCQFKIPFESLGVSEDEFYVISEKNNFVFDAATDFLKETFYDLTAKEIALPVIASEFYKSYNNIQENGPIAELDTGFEPIKFMKGKGFKNKDIADDYRSVNMTSLVSQDGSISKVCFKNEHSLNLKESNVKIGVERTREVIYATMKRMEDEKAIKPSNLIAINLALNAAVVNSLNNVAESITINCSFNKKIINNVEREVLAIYIKEVYDVRYTKIEVENEIYFK